MDMRPPRLQSPSPVAVRTPVVNPWAPRHNAYATPRAAAPPSAAIKSAVPFNFVLFTTALLLISHFGRPFELVLIGFHIPAVICTLGIIVLVASGGLTRLLRPTGIALLAFVFWLLISATQSTWRTGSLKYSLTYIAFWVTLLAMVANAPRSAKDLVRLAAVTGIACVFSIFFSSGGKGLGGRLDGTGTFGNSNELALLAGYAIPFIVLWALQFKNAVLRYGILLVGCGYLLITIGRTASRGGLVALFFMLGVYFFHSNALQKAWILAATVAGALGLLFVLPQATLDRLATVIYSLDTQTMNQLSRESEAMASSAERRELLMDALNMTIENPVFGVGSGQFSEYRYDHLRDSNGERKRYFPSHNTFAQIASESGLPGLFFYLMFLWTTYRTAVRVRKLTRASQHPDSKLFHQISTCIQAALVYFLACAFFLTCDRYPHQFVVAGMAIAMERLLEHWMSQPSQAPVWRMPWATTAPAAVAFRR